MLGTEVTEHLFRDIACGKLSLLMRYSWQYLVKSLSEEISDSLISREVLRYYDDEEITFYLYAYNKTIHRRTLLEEVTSIFCVVLGKNIHFEKLCKRIKYLTIISKYILC